MAICSSRPAGERKPLYLKKLELSERIQSIGMKKYTEQDIYKYLHPNTIKEKGIEYEHLYRMMIDTKIEGAVASRRGRAERRDNFNYLKKIEVPTLVVLGDNDFFLRR